MSNTLQPRRPIRAGMVLTDEEAAEYRQLRSRQRRRDRQRERRRASRSHDKRGLMSRVVPTLALTVVDDTTGEHTLGWLDDLYRLQLRLAVEKTVVWMLDDGASWADIARALDRDVKTVRERYGHVAKSRRSRGGQPAEFR